MLNKRLSIFAAFSVFVTSFSNAQTGWVKDGQVINTVTTAMPFLRINSDARAGGMGDVGIATTPDINGAFLNPSNMAFVEKDFGVGISFTPWLKRLVNDIYLTSLSGYGKIKDKGGKGEQAIGGSIRYFSLGNIDFTDENGGSLGSFRPNEFSLDAWYARKLAKTFSLGVGLRFAYSNLAGGQSAGGNVIKPAIAGAGDINWTWRQNFKKDGAKMSHDVAVGMNISNIGNKVSYTSSTVKDFIPTNLGIGFSYGLNIDAKNTWSFAFDINKLMVPTPSTVDKDSNGVYDYREKSVIAGMFTSFADAPGGFKEEMQEFMIGVGTEYMYNKQFGARFGYFYEPKTKGGRQYATAGVTVKYSIVGLNFSYLIPTSITPSPLDNTLRFSVLFELNKGGLKGQSKGVSLVDDEPKKEKKKKATDTPAPADAAPADGQ